MEYGHVLEHILAAWDLAAPSNKRGILQTEVREFMKDDNNICNAQAYAAGRLHDGLKHGNW